MSDGQKTPFTQSINRNAINKAQDAIQQTGQALPCSVVGINATVGACIVTVKFEVISGFTLPQVEIPHSGGEWIRYPVQIGNKGVVIPIDARTNSTTGLGKGIADMIQPANLSSLVFVPAGNAGWTPTDDPNKLVMYGHDGVIIKDSATGAVVVTVSSGGVHIHGGNVTIDDDCIIGGIAFLTHKHDDPQGGTVGVPHN
jgi:hypothetical protein